MFGYRIIGCFFLFRITIDLVKGGDYIHIVFYFCFADAHKLLIAYTLISGKKEDKLGLKNWVCIAAWNTAV